MAPGVVENSFCGLLSNEENLQVFKLLGNRCQSLCSTVVQLYQTQPPSHSHWIKSTTGVLCFVKDNIKKNFYFRLFCLKKNMKVWEQEMYNNMDYIEGTPFFHMFEAEECMVAFNFASIEEARDLRIVVHQKIQARKRREDKRTRQISQSQTLPSPHTQVQLYGHKKTMDPVDKQAKRRRNITKDDIGKPKNFKHISHVGWNSASGFDIDTEDEQLRTFFIKAGVSEKQLQDKSTRDYIYDFINRNGVREALVQETKKAEDNTPPTVPPRAPSSRPPHFRNAPPPPVPTKANNGNITPQKPKMNVAPPKKPAPLPVSAPSAPPPPPPPPPPPAPLESIEKVDRIGHTLPPPTPPTTAPHSPRIDISGEKAELMQSIKNGITLKPVEEQHSPQEESRNDFLREIQKGIQLRPIDERDIKPISSPVLKGTNDLAEILKERIAQRSRAIHSEDDDESSESADSDWDCD